MKWLIKSVQFGVLIHITWAAVTAIIISLVVGETFYAEQTFMGTSISFAIHGIPGEAYFTWPFHVAVFLNRLLYIYAFYRLWRMFGAFSHKRYFTQHTIGHLYVFTGAFTLFTISRIAISWIFHITSSGALPEGVAIEANFSNLEDLGYPILFFIIAHILNEARKNEEELDTYF